MRLNLRQPVDFHPLPLTSSRAHSLFVQRGRTQSLRAQAPLVTPCPIQLGRQRGGSSNLPQARHVRQIRVTLALGVGGAKKVDTHIDDGGDGG